MADPNNDIATSPRYNGKRTAEQRDVFMCPTNSCSFAFFKIQSLAQNRNVSSIIGQLNA